MTAWAGLTDISLKFIYFYIVCISHFRRVVGAGVIASTSRAIIETPLEFAKVSINTLDTFILSNNMVVIVMVVGFTITNAISAYHH